LSTCVGEIIGRRIGSKQVAKRKDSIALFEVITKRRSDANLSVPPWMSVKGTAGAAEPPVAPPPPPPAAEPAAPGAAARAWSSLASGTGGQLTLRLSYTHLLLAAAVLALVVIVSVWAAYRLGSATRQDNPPAKTTMAEKTPLGPHVVAGNADVAKSKSGSPAPAAATGEPAATATRVSGKYYLVIQSLVGATTEDQAEAEQIRAWCAQHGEPATVATHTLAKTGKSRYIVWSLRPFDSPSSAEALNYGRKIEALGRDYKARYKRYDFRQQRDGKFDPWFEVYRAQPAKK